jgi:hypothetical protein
MARKRAPALARFTCYYHPQSRAGCPIPNEDGRLPSVEVDAVNSAAAAELAHIKTGFPIVETVRVAEDIPPPEKPRPRRQAKPDVTALGLTTGAAMLAALHPSTEGTTS